jgi:hypothetical protein
MGADPIVEQAKGILRWLEHEGVDSITKRDMHQALRGRFKRVAELDPPLALLIAQGFIRRHAKVSNAGPGQPPSPRFDVNRCGLHRIPKTLRMRPRRSILRIVSILRQPQPNDEDLT